MTSAIWPDWRARLAEAGFSDWITVAAYLVAAILAVRAAGAARRTTRGRERIFWASVAAAMLFLGVNELFDLQTVLTSVGRTIAVEQGWYEDRRIYQFEFVLALATIGVVAALASVRLTRESDPSIRWALLGLVFIGAFVLIRAATFHHVDSLLGLGPNAFNLGSMQEMAGIVIVAAAAYRYRRAPLEASARTG